jgi:hypothetical protein
MDAGVGLDLAVYELPREQVLGLGGEYLLRPVG